MTIVDEIRAELAKSAADLLVAAGSMRALARRMASKTAQVEADEKADQWEREGRARLARLIAAPAAE
jgi:hypothetical protein